jgi:hypothetical protein
MRRLQKVAGLGRDGDKFGLRIAHEALAEGFDGRGVLEGAEGFPGTTGNGLVALTAA